MPDGSESPTRSLDTQALDPLIGRQVRDLRVLERIGRGGMGTVYKAEHLLLREPRALKVMRAELFHAMPKAVERFEREARIAVKLRHPNLVLLHDFFVDDGDRFLVMEFVVGRSLATVMEERGALPVEEACGIALQCCAGLAHAHEMGIVHRDLSPENVMITPSAAGPQVKIIDFGVARAAFETADHSRSEEEAALTRFGQFIGKPRYASPEQAGSLARGEHIDQRSDLYTLGLILFEMVTAAFPFRSESDIGYLAKHSFERPATPTGLRPDLEIPDGLERLILRCLEKDRARRFASARELAAALDWVIRSGGRSAAPFDRSEAEAPSDPDATGQLRVARFETASRRPGLLALAAVVTLLGVAAGATAWQFATRSEARPPARTTVVLPRSEPAPLPEAVAPVVEPAPTPVTAEPEPEQPEPVVVEPEVVAKAAPREEVAPREQAEQADPAKPSAPLQPNVERPPAPAPAPAPARAAPKAVAFSDAAEMSRAFDAALEFERSHDSTAAVTNWKGFRARSPSRELDERAKRRITDLILGGLREFK